MYPVCVSLFLCLSPLNMYVLLSESTLVTKPNELENYILSWCLWNHILVLILGLAHNIQVEGDGIDQISRHQILLFFPDHHHYHSFIIIGSDKTTSFRPHHASFRQILKYPINFLSGSKIVVVHINLSVSKLRYIRNDEVCLSQKISAVSVTSPLFCRISVRGSQTCDEVSGLRLSGTPARTTKCFVSIIIRSSVVTGAKRGRFRRR